MVRSIRGLACGNNPASLLSGVTLFLHECRAVWKSRWITRLGPKALRHTFRSMLQPNPRRSQSALIAAVTPSTTVARSGSRRHLMSTCVAPTLLRMPVTPAAGIDCTSRANSGTAVMLHCRDVNCMMLEAGQGLHVTLRAEHYASLGTRTVCCHHVPAQGSAPDQDPQKERVTGRAVKLADPAMTLLAPGHTDSFPTVQTSPSSGSKSAGSPPTHQQ